MRTLFFLLLTFSTGVAMAQPFAIGTSAITFTDPVGARAIACDVHYPAVATGTDAALADGAFPVIVFGHGFVMTVDAYTYIWQHYVPLGYIVALPTTEGGFSPDHARFGADLAYVAHALQLAGTDDASVFSGHVAPATALMGHSMGGGAAFLGAANNTDIQTLVTLAAAETDPSAIAAAAQVQVPALVFSASEDCITPIATNAQPMYDALIFCKGFVDITGGGHCYFGDNSFTCSFGELTCGPDLTISREQQHAVVTDLIDPWLDHYLRGSEAALTTVSDSLQGGTRYTAAYHCLSTSVAQLAATPFTAHWDARSRSVQVNGIAAGTSVQCTDASGRMFAHSTSLGTTVSFSLPGMRDGMYLVVVQDATGSRVQRVIVTE